MQQGKISMNKIFDYSVKGAWNAENDQSMNIVKETMSKNNIRFTRYAYKKHGQLFKATIQKKGDGQVPIKKGMDIDKYGGYKSATCTYFAFVEIMKKKGKQERYFVPIDLYIEKEYLENPQCYVAKYLNIEADQVRIIIPCIKIDSLIEVDGFPMHISGKSNQSLLCKPAMQLILSNEQERYIKKISKFIKGCGDKEKEPTQFDKLSAEENIELYDVLTDKLTNTKFNIMLDHTAKVLANNRNTFLHLSLYKQCYILLEIIKILHANPVIGNLTAINGSKNSGKIPLSMHIQPKYQSFKLIYQSITGLFVQEIDLLK